MKLRERAIWGLAVLALVTGCGSTVQYSQSSTQQGSGLTTSAAGGVSSPDAGLPADTVNQPGAASSSSSTGSVAGPAGSGGVATGPGVANGSTSGSSGRGPSGSTGTARPLASGAPITVGVLAVDYSGLAQQFGVKAPTNYFDVYRAIFAYLNKHGGIAGHQIKAVYHTSNGAASDRTTEDEVACTAFTQDSHVQLVFSEIIYEPGLTACLLKHNIAQIDDGQYGLGNVDLKALPNLISPESVSLEREAAIVFAGMSKAGVLKRKSVIGVVRGGCSDEKAAYDHSVVPLAAQYGFTLVDNQLGCYQGAAGLGEATSQIQAAVLKFRSNGVEQVLAFTAAEGYTLTVFARQASSQNYFPGYLLTSNGYPNGNADQSSAASYPADALPHMHGMGWAPSIDVGPHSTPTGAVRAAQSTCTGMDPTQGGSKTQSASNRYNELQVFFSTCDDILMLSRIASSNGLDLSPKALRTGFEEISRSFVAAGTYGGTISITAAHGDGAITAAPFSFKSGCACFTSDGPPQTIPG